VSGQLHAPASLPPGKNPRTHLIRRWVSPRAGLGVAVEHTNLLPLRGPRSAHSLVPIQTTLRRLLHPNVWGCQARNVLAKKCRHFVKQATNTNVNTKSHALSVLAVAPHCRDRTFSPFVSSQFCSQKCPKESTHDTWETPGYFTSANKAWITSNVYHFTTGEQPFGVMVQKELEKLMVLYCSEWCRTLDSDYSNVSNVTEVISNKWCSESYGYQTAINHHPSYFFVRCSISHNAVR